MVIQNFDLVSIVKLRESGNIFLLRGAKKFAEGGGSNLLSASPSLYASLLLKL